MYRNKVLVRSNNDEIRYDNGDGCGDDRITPCNDPLKEPNVEKILEHLRPIVETLSPTFIEHEKTIAPQIRRRQWFTFTAIIIILVAVSAFAWNEIIDGSAAVVIFSAVIGYLLGNKANPQR